MTYKPIANELQGINGLLITLDGPLSKYSYTRLHFLPDEIYEVMEEARSKTVALVKYYASSQQQVLFPIQRDPFMPFKSGYSPEVKIP